MDPWGQHLASPGRAGEEAGFWSCEALKSTVQVAADSKEEPEKEGIRRPGVVDKVFPNKGDRQQGRGESRRRLPWGRLCWPPMLHVGLHRGPVTGWTRDSSDFLASLFLQKGSLTLWQPVNLPGLF